MDVSNIYKVQPVARYTARCLNV
ncbi:hypothetical protein CCACVL1_04036 [Corchorus capsularis]|uniref:Uncharacterized protein n=1 Tax=Corchorus capsularis TaxID=210143 RepID=A0A1R3JVI1_COCAP|nr:hypothetical protein CCACVL1_04036 [Corchorus capsularis]